MLYLFLNLGLVIFSSALLVIRILRLKYRND